MRVLHVLRQLNPGGIECWLDRLVHGWPARTRPDFHFALECSDFGSLAPSVSACGVTLHHCPSPSNPSAFVKWNALLSSAGPFDVIHCHNHHAAAFPLALAARHGVPVRIAHSHADFRRHARRRHWPRRLYEASARRLLDLFATARLAVSAGAAQDLFGARHSEARIVPCGADFEPLLNVERKPDPNGFKLVHVGRLVPEKNHEFLFHLLRELAVVHPQAHLQLVGDGPGRAHLESLAHALGLTRRIDFLGNRSDIAACLEDADAFVFPSHSEGLGLAAIEAQAAGVPSLIASHLPQELDLIPGLCRRLALGVPLSRWVSSLLEMKYVPQISKYRRREILAGSSCSIESNVAVLGEIYAG